MPSYTLVVMSQPVEGREEEYNAWYTGRHLDDVLRLPGLVSARRYKLGKDQVASHPYLALYNIETDTVDETLAELMKRANSDDMPISEALGDVNMMVFEAITPTILPK